MVPDYRDGSPATSFSFLISFSLFPHSLFLILYFSFHISHFPFLFSHFAFLTFHLLFRLSCFLFSHSLFLISYFSFLISSFIQHPPRVSRNDLPSRICNHTQDICFNTIFIITDRCSRFHRALKEVTIYWNGRHEVSIPYKI